MYCSCCGKEIREDERYCDNCGQNNEGYVEKKSIETVEIYQQANSNSANVQASNTSQQNNIKTIKEESAAIGVLAMIFGILGGWLGLMFSIIGLCTYQNPEHRTKCKIGLGFFIGWSVIAIILGIVAAGIGG